MNKTDRTSERPSDGNNRTTVRVYDRTAQDKRITKRHSFEIYEDQLVSLKERKAQSMLAGQEKSMSEMVREALDNFLNQHK